MTYVELSHVSFGHAAGPMLFSDVTLRLGAGVTAVVGENGAGKSSLLALISGRLSPTAGQVRVEPAEARVVSCPQDAFVCTSEVRAFVEARDRDAHRLRAQLALDADMLARFGTLSPGERRRVQVGAALYARPDVLLLDEPSNHVDHETRRVLIRALAGGDRVTLLVSHDRQLIDAVAERTLRIERGALRLTEGGTREASKVWADELSNARDARNAQKARLRAAEAKLASARRASAQAEQGRSARAMMRNPHDRDGRSVGQKTRAAWAEARASRNVSVRREEADKHRAALSQRYVAKQHGARVHAGFVRCPRPTVASLLADALCVGDRCVLREVRLRLGREARLRIAGPNGAGKSTLLGALYDALPPQERAHVTFLRQELSQAQEREVLENVRGLDRARRARVFDVVAALGLDPERLISTPQPSHGEARKLVLALGLGLQAWALILDEPTNHLDLPAVERLEAALIDYPGALVVVSHDPAFLEDGALETLRIQEGVLCTA